MTVKIILFAQLAELAGTRELEVENMKDTSQLTDHLQKHYPEFRQSNYLIAVEKELIHSNTPLPDGCTVALLPPYSGG